MIFTSLHSDIQKNLHSHVHHVSYFWNYFNTNNYMEPLTSNHWTQYKQLYGTSHLKSLNTIQTIIWNLSPQIIEHNTNNYIEPLTSNHWTQNKQLYGTSHLKSLKKIQTIIWNRDIQKNLHSHVHHVSYFWNYLIECSFNGSINCSFFFFQWLYENLTNVCQAKLCCLFVCIHWHLFFLCVKGNKFLLNLIQSNFDDDMR
jgi:hypothetical protein